MKSSIKVIKSKTLKVYKNKKLNKANFGVYNLNDYQVFLFLISKIGGVDEMGKYLQPDKLERNYTITAKEFALQFNLDVGNVYSILKLVAKTLSETSITLEQPELFTTWHISLCSFTEYNHKEGSLSVRFSEEIMPYLAQVKSRFVLYNLKEIANFGSLYTTRLYELIQEFKDTGVIIKSLEQLRNILAVGNKYPVYKDFKVKTFNHAVDEINSQYKSIGLKYNEIKDGRKVVALEFIFNPILSRVVDSISGRVGIDLLSKLYQ